MGGDLLEWILEATFGGVCHCEMDADDPHVINIHYPAAFPTIIYAPRYGWKSAR